MARREDGLPADRLARRCDPAQFEFTTTAELDGEMELVGQPRAEAALRFGVGIENDGYNLFVLGPYGTGKRTFVEHVLKQHAAERAVPRELCYVNHFDDSATPVALHVAPGRAQRLHDDMARLIEEVAAALPAAFEDDAYQAQRSAIDEEYKERSAVRLREIHEAAQEKGIAMLQTPAGFMFAPVRDDEVLDAEAFGRLDEDERERLKAEIEGLQEELQRVLRETPRWERERQARQRELSRETARRAVGPPIDELQGAYAAESAVVRHLDAVRRDLIDNAPTLRKVQEETPEDSLAAPLARQPDASPLLRRYRVNVLVDHAAATGAPVVFEDHPTLQNLLGRVEYGARMGTLVTDFTLIRPGALHRANGGFLVLEALKVLQQPFAWEALKRALRARRLRIESYGEAYGLVRTVSLEPEPVPLDLKVVLLGEPRLYYLLAAYDPEFPELFKVAVDFGAEIDRSPETQQAVARLIAAMVRRHALRAFDAAAVARVLDRLSRTIGDAEKLSARTAELADLLREASYWAGTAGREIVGAEDVQTAVDAQIHRADRIRERLQEATLRELLKVATEGEVVGQVNGLSVVELGGFAFGRPHRITATARVGKGEVVDIEREVELGGPLHSKGVLILSGFLGARFAGRRPLSLAASLVFEQSYSSVEGDSASSAELYALLSAIARQPARQSLAVTGSVDQFGHVQPIGGVNEKVEGFFDLCRARGLTGEQGVLIPAANESLLMLKDELVEAVAAGRFHVHAVATVHEGVRLLMGLALGEPDEHGDYPDGTLGRRIQARLAGFAEAMREHARPDDTGP